MKPRVRDQTVGHRRTHDRRALIFRTVVSHPDWTMGVLARRLHLRVSVLTSEIYRMGLTLNQIRSWADDVRLESCPTCGGTGRVARRRRHR